MKTADLESRMRALEYFHSIRALPGAWVVLRVDGRSFTRLTQTDFEKPFDARFHGLMMTAAEALLTGLDGLYAYTESDEISLLLPRETSLFDRELEKLVSVSAGIASATFTHALGAPAHFDCRMWMAPDAGDVIDYFRWRQADAARCGLNGWCYWTLVKEGATAAEATKRLKGTTAAQKNELLFARGINFNDVPVWQRRGAGVLRETYERPGVDPRTSSATVAVRRRVRRDENLPLGEDYAAFLNALLHVAVAATAGDGPDRVHQTP